MCERFWLRRVVQDHLPQSKTSGVLRGHAQAWDKWWPWLAARLRARGREATIEQLCECPEMVAALLAKVFAQSKGRTAVHRLAYRVGARTNCEIVCSCECDGVEVLELLYHRCVFFVLVLNAQGPLGILHGLVAGCR